MDANSHADQQGSKKLIPSPDKKEANTKSLSYENQVHVAIRKLTPSSDNTVLMEANNSTFVDQPPTNKHSQVQSNPNPHIVYHKKPSQSLQSCDTTCNTHPAITSKQSPDQPCHTLQSAGNSLTRVYKLYYQTLTMLHMYIVESHEDKEQPNFEGAPKFMNQLGY